MNTLIEKLNEKLKEKNSLKEVLSAKSILLNNNKNLVNENQEKKKENTSNME